MIHKLTELCGREGSAQIFIHEVQGSNIGHSIVMVFYIFPLKLIILYLRNNRCIYFLIFSRSVNLTFRLLFIIIIIIITIIEFFTSELWLGNTHLSFDIVINRIRLGGLICSLKSFLQLNMCQELQIFEAVYMYWGAG